MRTYNHEPCPKCGYQITKDEHIGTCGFNRIQRDCQRCKYRWEEAPLDYDELKESLALAEFHKHADRMLGHGPFRWVDDHISRLKEKLAARG